MEAEHFKDIQGPYSSVVCSNPRHYFLEKSIQTWCPCFGECYFQNPIPKFQTITNSDNDNAWIYFYACECLYLLLQGACNIFAWGCLFELDDSLKGLLNFDIFFPFAPWFKVGNKLAQTMSWVICKECNGPPQRSVQACCSSCVSTCMHSSASPSPYYVSSLPDDALFLHIQGPNLTGVVVSCCVHTWHSLQSDISAQDAAAFDSDASLES